MEEGEGEVVVSVTLEIDGRIQPKQRTNGHRRFLPAETRRSQELIAWHCKRVSSDMREKLHRTRLTVDVEIEAIALRGDIDNIAKTVFDGLQDGGLIKNDVQIDELRIRRTRSKRDRATITVQTIEEVV